MMEYQRNYTDLRAAKMSFAQFMDFLSEIHAIGVEKGSAMVASTEQPSYFDAAPLEEVLEYRVHQ